MGTTFVNPTVLVWARQRAGYSIEQIARAMKRDPEEIRRWETGESYPAYTLLEDLAYRYYKIPLAVFLFPEPPDIEDPVTKFRRLPDYELSRLSPDTTHLMRLARGYQESLIELAPPEFPTRRIFADIDARSMAAPDLASASREYVGVSLDQQFEFGGAETAFKVWRAAIETAGVFCFKDSFKDQFVSGFSLLDDRFPVVMVNNSNSYSRQVFTLAHELGHILRNVHGLTDTDEAYLRYMSPSERDTEIYCNEYAAELLVPMNAFQRQTSDRFDADLVSPLADRFAVSREVILRRFLDLGQIDDDYSQAKAAEWNLDYLRGAKIGSGGNWYSTRLAYLGESYVRLVYETYAQGRLSKADLAQHLNMNAKNIDALESYLHH